MIKKALLIAAMTAFCLVLFSNADAHIKAPEEMSQHTDPVWCDQRTTAYYTGMYERLSGTTYTDILKKIDEDVIPSVLRNVVIDGWQFVDRNIEQGHKMSMLNIQIIARGYYNKCIQNKEVEVYIDMHKKVTNTNG